MTPDENLVTESRRQGSLDGTTRSSPRLLGIATALPEHRVSRDEAKRFAADLFRETLGNGKQRLLEVFDHSGVESRSVCMPVEWYEQPHELEETNGLYIQHGLELAARAASGALRGAELRPEDVDHVVVVSSTGIAAPSLDARLANTLGFRPDVARTPIWGLGCAGGAAGLARARDLALAHPGACILLVTIELCSLTFQRGDVDRRNLVALSLFSDGAAAAVVSGAGFEGGVDGSVELLASDSILWPDTLDVMGWTVDRNGLHVVFSRDIPALVRERVRLAVDSFLAREGLALRDLAHVVAHPGGPKVLAELATALEIPAGRLRHAQEVLRTCGNMSSPTCLFVLQRALRAGDIVPGDRVLILALGPGFALEQVLVRAL